MPITDHNHPEKFFLWTKSTCIHHVICVSILAVKTINLTHIISIKSQTRKVFHLFSEVCEMRLGVNTCKQLASH